jgi:membrane peptidoglycan carboxypeptidase
LASLESALSRRDQVLELMARHSEIPIGDGRVYTVEREALDQARSERPDVSPPVFPIKAPHFVLTYVVPELEALVGRDALLHDGLVVTTSLDLALQEQAQLALVSVIARYEQVSGSHNGAAIVIQPASGEVLAMVGSRDYFNAAIDGEVNNLLAPNSPGSSFKPFVYLTAFMRLGWTPGTVLQDTPITYREVDGATFQPQNPVRNSYRGPVSVRDALGNSLNVPAFKTALQLELRHRPGYCKVGQGPRPLAAAGAQVRDGLRAPAAPMPAAPRRRRRRTEHASASSAPRSCRTP